MTGPSSRIGHSWTAEEYDRAVALRKLGMPLADIARALGRTQDGVDSRLRMGPSRREVHPWTQDDITLCLALSAQGMPPRKIALRVPGHNAKGISAKLADVRRTRIAARDYAEEAAARQSSHTLDAWAVSLPWRVDRSIGATEWWPR